MDEFDSLVVSGKTLQEFSRSLTRVLQALPSEKKARVRKYWDALGMEAAFKQINGWNVAQILASPLPAGRKPIVSGELDGIRFELYEADDTDTEN